MRLSRPVRLTLAALALTGCATGASVSAGTTSQAAYVPDSASTTLSLPVDVTTSSSATAAPATSSAASTSAGTSAAAPASRSTSARITVAASSSTPSASPASTSATSTSTATAAPRAVVPAATAASTYVPRVARKYGTGNATQIITVTAPSSTSTTATLSAWKKVGTGWVRTYGPLTAWVGVDGVGRASEYTSKTPAGSFTLTQAFGRLANPGTRLPYFKTTPRDWWVGQSGPYYNTHQRCTAGQYCPWHSPSEHLYYVTPYYNYAAVIDYNTRNAPGGVRQHAGSAFFFHVHPTGTGGTGGCVAIKQSQLVKILNWLRPARHPRIIIGVA